MSGDVKASEATIPRRYRVLFFPGIFLFFFKVGYGFYFPGGVFWEQADIISRKEPEGKSSFAILLANLIEIEDGLM